jgi:predicted small metal-binding protein
VASRPAVSTRIPDDVRSEKENLMAKELRCGDIMPGCPTVLEGKDEKEVMAKAAEHAKKAHNMPTISPEVASKVQKAIHTK